MGAAASPELSEQASKERAEITSACSLPFTHTPLMTSIDCAFVPYPVSSMFVTGTVMSMSTPPKSFSLNILRCGEKKSCNRKKKENLSRVMLIIIKKSETKSWAKCVYTCRLSRKHLSVYCKLVTFAA